MPGPRALAWTILAAATAGATAMALAPPRRPEGLATPRPTRTRLAPPVRPTPAKASAPTPSSSLTPAVYSIRRVLDTGGPIRFGRWFWDEAGVPAGPMLVTVDTDAQVLSVFRGGYEIGTTAVIYGADDKPTPLGVFPILMKDAHHRSSTYGNAPMPFTLRLTSDGVSIHGSPIAADYATHGCIGVPVAFAARLFAAVAVGDRVVITRGETLALGGSVDAVPPTRP